MSNKGKAHMMSTQSKKRNYLAWTKKMDEILIEILHNQMKEGNKADGEWKPQAYQAVADELRIKLGMFLTTENVKNRIKSWKKHYAVIMDIRTFSKFKWDEDKKMIVIAIEDLEQSNILRIIKMRLLIELWDDICTLCGPDRAMGDGVEMYDEAAEAMDDELQSEGGSSTKGTFSFSGSKKQKRDRLADAVSELVSCVVGYVQSKPKEIPKPTPEEVYEVVKNVDVIGRHQVMPATKMFMNGPPSELKSLSDEEKLDWVLLCLKDLVVASN